MIYYIVRVQSGIVTRDDRRIDVAFSFRGTSRRHSVVARHPLGRGSSLFEGIFPLTNQSAFIFTGPQAQIPSSPYQQGLGLVRGYDRVPRGRTICFFLAFFGLFPSLSLSHCFFLSFFLFEIERLLLQFPFLVSLLFLFVLVHGHSCSVVVGFSIFQPPFPSSEYVIPVEKYTCMTSVDCRVISSSHVQFDEMKVRH